MKNWIFKSLWLSFFMVISIQAFPQTEILEKYKTTEKDKRPALFKEFLVNYAKVYVNQYEIKMSSINSLEDEVAVFAEETTSDTQKAIEAVASDKKVVCFISNAAFGILDSGVTHSSSWEMNFPLWTGFYFYSDKTFVKEGINYHVGKKETNPIIKYYIIGKE